MKNEESAHAISRRSRSGSAAQSARSRAKVDRVRRPLLALPELVELLGLEQRDRREPALVADRADVALRGQIEEMGHGVTLAPRLTQCQPTARQTGRMASPTRRADSLSPKRAAVEADVGAAVQRLLSAGAAYGDLSVDRIAGEAGISRTAFYFYFRDKRELLLRVTQETTDRLYAQAESWWGAEGDGAERLAEALRAVVVLYREHGLLLRAVVEASAYDEQVAAFWRAVVGRFVDATRERIEAEQRSGRAAGLDAAAVAFSLAWMTERAVYQHLSLPTATSEEALVEALTAIWVRSVYG
jgi:AcrR family transcriptional regulator